MKNGDNSPWGAKIERGRITAIEGEEPRRYTVESIDRPGVTGCGLTGREDTYTIDETVYFFLFEDGTGAVLGPTE